jgi:hypothetical protein
LLVFFTAVDWHIYTIIGIHTKPLCLSRTLNILLFTGHLIDQADRHEIRFPNSLIDKARALLRTEIESVLHTHTPQMAISSLAAGGDLLFAGEALGLKIPLIVFLPFEVDKFLDVSVAYDKSTTEPDLQLWTHQFHQIIGQAQKVVITGSNDSPLEAALTFCNDSMLAYALAHAGNDPQKVLALALVKSTGEIKKGGSSEFMRSIRSHGVFVKQIWPRK